MDEASSLEKWAIFVEKRDSLLADNLCDNFKKIVLSNVALKKAKINPPKIFSLNIDDRSGCAA